VNIELASAATIVNKPIYYGPYMAEVQKLRLIWLN